MAGKKDLDRAEVLDAFARMFGKPDPISADQAGVTGLATFGDSTGRMTNV